MSTLGMDALSLFPDNISGTNNDDQVSIPINFECNILHQPNILPTVLHLEDIFVFQINVRDIIGVYKFCREDQCLKLEYTVRHSHHFSRTFIVPFRDIAGTDRNCARRNIHVLLGHAGVPRAKRRPLLGKIYSEAVRLAKNDGGEYKRIPVVVDLARLYARTYINEIQLDEEEEEEEDGDECRPTPARRSAIEALEKVRVEETEVCAVCLEEMVVGSEGSKMPCKHVFHGNCIAAWLRKANLCPLCRFQLKP